MDILALINSGINFILYCSMSRQFRSTFNLLFRPKFLDKWLPVSQDDDNQFMRTDGRTDGNCHTTQVTQVQQKKQGCFKPTKRQAAAGTSVVIEEVTTPPSNNNNNNTNHTTTSRNLPVLKCFRDSLLNCKICRQRQMRRHSNKINDEDDVNLKATNKPPCSLQ